MFQIRSSRPSPAILLLIPVLAAAAASAAEKPVLEHRVEAVFDVESHSVEIADRLTVPAALADVTDHLRLGDGMTVVSITGPDGAAIDPAFAVTVAEDEDGPYLRLDLAAVGAAPDGGMAAHTIELKYGGVFHESVEGMTFSRENVGGEITATISDEGIYLSAMSEWLAWTPDAMATHDLSFDTPAGFETVTQGERTRHEEQNGRLMTRWVARHPADGLTLVANRYFVHEEPVREGVVSYTFFLEDDARLRATYMERTKAYIAMYEEMIGPYPYAKFATVENWFPTGYGMPSYTLLGGQVLRLPFIPYTSFGHEICHNWWGNSVFVDTEGGNWCEGITVYCADYEYKKRESEDEAYAYRRNLLKDYAAYVREPEHDFPLTEFRSRHSGATRAVGYGKSMMVFHMIERIIGRENFVAGMHRIAADHEFAKASWDDFMTTFGELGNVDLTAFQQQWLNRAGAPFLQVSEVKFDDDGVSFRLEQGEPAYQLDVPVVLTTAGGEREELVALDQASANFRLEATGLKKIAVDPACHLFRRLAHQEIEPTISQVLGDDAATLVTDDPAPEFAQAVEDFAHGFLEDKPYAKTESGRIPMDLSLEQQHTHLVFNPSRELFEYYQLPEFALSGKTLVLAGKRYSLKEYDLVMAVANPFYPTTTDLIVLSDSPTRIRALSRRVVHYGKYSWLLLPHGQGPVVKGNWPLNDSPLVAARGAK